MKDKELKILISYWSGESKGKNLSTVKQLREKYPQEYDELEQAWKMDLFEQSGFKGKDHRKLLAEIALQNRKSVDGIFISNRILRIAAAVLLALLLGGASSFLELVPRTITNTSMAMKELSLPDQTRVTLDQGAEIRYRTSLTGRFNRQCTLSGRAYFQVRRDESENFSIETTHATVTVLGTKFTLSTLQNRMQLVLEEGSVKVSSQHNQDLAILNQPGEQLIAGAEGIEKQNLINQDLYGSWLNGKLQFNNCTVGEAVDFLEDTWGWEFELPDTISSEFLLMGTAPADDPALIVEAIRLIIGENN